jgi:hypothetical protein
MPPTSSATIAGRDRILAGTLTLQSSASMNVTLSSSQAQMPRVVVQGHLPSNFNLTLASSNFALGEYTIWNKSSAGGGGVLCQTTGGGECCVVSQGAMRQIYADGINAQFANNQTAAASPHRSS